MRRLLAVLATLAAVAVGAAGASADTSYCGHYQSGTTSNWRVDKFNYHVWSDGSYHNDTGNYHFVTTWAWVDLGLLDPGRWVKVHNHVRRCH